MTNKQKAYKLLEKLAADDMVIKSKGFKEQTIPWKKTIVNYYEVKEEHKTYQARKPKVPRSWHDPFGLGART